METENTVALSFDPSPLRPFIVAIINEKLAPTFYDNSHPVAQIIREEIGHNPTVRGLISEIIGDKEDRIDYADLADKIDYRRLANMSDVTRRIADQFDASDIASEVSTSDIASEISVSEIASEIDAADIAREIDISDLAENINYRTLARALLSELAVGNNS